MAKKEGVTIVIKKVQGGGGGAHGGAWKVAYADFVTAMMAFFMVMWLMGSDEETKQAVSHYFNSPNTPYKSGRDPQSETVNPLGEKFGQGDTILKGANGEVPADLVQSPMREVKDDLEAKLGEVAFGLELDLDVEELKFSILGDDLFEEGERLSSVGKKKLDQVASALKKVQGNLLIEGHLGPSRQIASEDPYTLSMNQAVAVMRYFQKNHQIDEDRMCPRGIASRRAWSSTESGIKADPRNRRMEFTISQRNPCSG